MPARQVDDENRSDIPLPIRPVRSLVELIMANAESRRLVGWAREGGEAGGGEVGSGTGEHQGHRTGHNVLLRGGT